MDVYSHYIKRVAALIVQRKCWKIHSRHRKKLYLILIPSVVTVITLVVILTKQHSTTHTEQFVYNCSKDFGYPMEITQDDIDRSVYPNRTHPFRYISYASHTCQKVSEVYILTLVKSAVRNFSQRYHIRRTWGKDAKKKDRRLIFLLGYDEEQQFLVNYENTIYGDIIQQNFKDSYYNNTYKTIMAFRWISEFCPNARYIQFTDDDMYINIANSLQFLKRTDASNVLHLYTGLLVKEPVPERINTSRWYISTSDYGFECYPPYIAGGFIIVNRLVAKQFNQIIPYIKKMPFDDVFLGIVAQKLSIRPTENVLVALSKESVIEKVKCLIATHGFRTAESFTYAFNITHDNPLN